MNNKRCQLKRSPVVAAVVAALALSGCPSARDTSREKISIGIQKSPAMALVMVAKDQGLFANAGLDADLKEFTAGKFALQAFLGGSLDFAVVGDVPVTLSTLQGSRFWVLSQVVEKTVDEVRVVARRDGQITDAAQYFLKKKRKLATSVGGGPEFFTYTFLKKLGIPDGQVEILSQKPEDMPAALASGSVDAVSVFDPFAYIAQKQLGSQALVFTDASIYSELYVLTLHPSTLDKSPALPEKVLRALVAAQEYIAAHPAESKAVVAKYTLLEPAVVDAVWKDFVFAPALTQQLLDYQRQEAAWAQATGKLTVGAATPDFRKSIYDGPLRRVKPDAVHIQ